MTILSMIKDAADELSLPRPSVAINSTDPQVRQLVRMAQNEGRALAKRHPWTVLLSEHSFTTVAAGSQTTSSIPSDLGRIMPGTMFNRTDSRPVFGPIDGRDWQATQASLVTQADPTFRIRQGAIYITPTPSAGDSVYYEYVSNKWCESSAGTAQTKWTADTDTGKLDEFIMTLGIVWRFRAAKGLPHANELTNYEREVADAIIRDGTRPKLFAGEPAFERTPVPPTFGDTYVFS
jgi:hypothetical protein